MKWEAWVLLIWIALEVLTEILTIGEPRRVYTPLIASADLAFYVFFAWCVFRLAGKA